MAEKVQNSAPQPLPAVRDAIAFVRLIRIEYCVLGALGVITGGLLVAPSFPDVPLIVSAVSVFLVAAGCYALDDYFDRDTDAANFRNDRPLLGGSLSLHAAATTGTVAFVLAGITAVIAGPWTAGIVITGAVAAMVYNRWLQGIPVVKNVLLAGAFPAPILIGGLSAGSTNVILWYAAGLAYILGLGFEIMIDIGDAAGDQSTGVVTLSTTRGIGVAAKASSAFLLAGTGAAMLPFFVHIDGRIQWDILFIVLISAAGLALGTVVMRLLRSPSPAPILALKLRAFTALHIFVLAYVLGALI